MTFLQPWMLWGLLAAALPILIHLLNRLRFRTVHWGAMLFLLRASRSSTRHARLRQWILLACRALAVFFFAFALTRPLVGGWIGRSVSGAPDTILILLDRSASMEDVDPRRQASKRAYALRLFAAVPRELWRGSQIVLIDSALRQPQELASLEALPDLEQAGPTETAADLPALFRVATDWLLNHTGGRTEIWVASDLQASNWKPDHPEWNTMGAQCAALPQPVRVRVLSLAEPVRHNRSLTLRVAGRRRAAGPPRFDLGLDLRRTDVAEETIPVTLTLNGTRSTFDLVLRTPTLALSRTVDLPPDPNARGGGRLELPADENNADHTCYFVYGDDPARRAALVAADAGARRLLALAAAPSPNLQRRVDEADASEGSALAWPELDLVFWQAAAPNPAAEQALRRFAEDGGAILLLPPGDEAQPAGFGLAWGDTEDAPSPAPFRISLWEENDGPLARTANGENLPVSSLEIRRRQTPIAPETGADAAFWVPLARFADGRPFLLRQRVGRGVIYACASLPQTSWSSLGEGAVLVPMIQRMLDEGAARRMAAFHARCGVWTPAPDDAPWRAVDATEPRDPRLHAGVYESGGRLVALNRPSEEDDPIVVPSERVEKLLGDVRISVVENLGASEQSLQREIWPTAILLAVLFLLAEAALLLTEQERQPSRARNARPMEL